MDIVKFLSSILWRDLYPTFVTMLCVDVLDLMQPFLWRGDCSDEQATRNGFFFQCFQ